nr:hypothetical protein [Peribacillus sp. TH27]
MKFIKSFILVTFSFFCMITPAFASVPGVDKSMKKGTTKGIVSVAHPLVC